MKKSLYFLLLLGLVTPQLSAMEIIGLKPGDKISGIGIFKSYSRPGGEAIKRDGLEFDPTIKVWVKPFQKTKDEIFTKSKRKRGGGPLSNITNDAVDRGYLILSAYLASVPEDEKQSNMVSLRKFCIDVGDDGVAEIIPKLVSSLVEKQYKDEIEDGDLTEKEKHKLDRKIKRMKKIATFSTEFVMDEEMLTMEDFMSFLGLDKDSNKDFYFDPAPIRVRIRKLENIFCEAVGLQCQPRVKKVYDWEVKKDSVAIQRVGEEIERIFGRYAVSRLKMQASNSKIKKPIWVICRKFLKDFNKNYKKNNTVAHVLREIQKKGKGEYDKKHAYRKLRDYLTKDHIDFPSLKNTDYRNYRYSYNFDW
jgi:hypothetical protein